MLFDSTTSAGGRALARLTDELVIWLVTVSPDGRPQPSPVWFWWTGAEFVVYSLESVRVRNITANPRVALHLDGNGEGGDIVIVEGIAHIDRSLPSAAEHVEYREKYREKMDSYGWTPEGFASRYSVPLRIEPVRARYW